MNNEIFSQQEAHLSAEPPAEIKKMMSDGLIPENVIRGWFAIPTLRRSINRVSQAELSTNLVDIVATLSPFFDDPILFRTLRTIDLLDGCGHQCDTCFADSVVPSKMFSWESIKRIWQRPEFIAMLARDSFRYGSSGDILDHPYGPEIVDLTLRATANFPGFDGYHNGRRSTHEHQIKVMTNYRPNLEDNLDKLLLLCLQNQKRFHLTISLPFNTHDQINARFEKFIKDRPEFFGTGYPDAEDGLHHYFSSKGLTNIGFMDVRHPLILHTFGRVIEESQRAKKVARYDWDTPSERGFSNRGLCKPYLNADGLWLMIYGTTRESHTTRIFTPITPENLPYLAQIPYHPDFPQPDNWPGLLGTKNSYRITDDLLRQSPSTQKPFTIVRR